MVTTSAPTAPQAVPRALAEPEWKALAAAHAERVETLTAGRRERASRGQRHPVEDFLFTYYSHRPSRLRRWHPGAGTALLGESASDRGSWTDYGPLGEGFGVDPAAFVTRRGETVRFVRDLLLATASRPAQLGCFGLHEWAMLYRTRRTDVRHEDWPLRLGHEGTDEVVERHRIRCTHHDAFRFFTPEAVSRNTLQPRREDQIAFEQPGCLHVSMDLYKWAYKLSPAAPSDLVLDCFRLARDVRELDMRASPYDLSDLGYEPVTIETAEGKAAYAQAQREFAARAEPLRTALVGVCQALLRPTGG